MNWLRADLPARERTMNAVITKGDLELVARSITRQMRTGSRADKALLVAASQLDNKTLRRILIELAAELTAAAWLQKSLSMADAFGMQPGIFPASFCQSLAGCDEQPSAYCLLEHKRESVRAVLPLISSERRLAAHEACFVGSI